MYRDACFECPTGQYLDLDTLQCVTQCNQDSQIAINDSQFGNRLICRSFQYYVNPDSDSIVELGTIDYPYKELSYAFIEILNYHSHTDRNLTVNLMEATTNILGLRQANIANITSVNIMPYSLTSPEPGNTTILIKDEINIVNRPSTLFNIMKTFEMRIDEKITNNPDITEQEKLRLEFDNYNFLIIRSNFMMQNMNITSDRANVLDDVFLFYIIYIQEKTITFKNMHFSVSGTISITYDPLNMNMMNIEVDYYRNQGGFEQYMFCNYPEAVLNTTVYVDNIHFFYSRDRQVIHVNKQALRNQQPSEFIVNNYRSDMYLNNNEQHGILAVFLTNN